MTDMEPFLRQVASHYLVEGGLDRICFVFPNKRSMAFFRRHLSTLVSEAPPGKPFLMPGLLSVNDFYHAACGRRPSDRLRLTLEMYSCYKAIVPDAESLDDFLFWGDVILSDFDDIDKYLADASSVLKNVAEYKAMQDDLSYLSETQRKAMEGFLSHFNGSIGSVKERFLKTWNILLPLYDSFRKHLDDKALAYEGMVYRALAERASETPVVEIMAKAFPGVDKFVFTGLNALSESEHFLLRKMRDAGIAEFCWDYSGPFVKDPANKSSTMMSVNVGEFPSSFEPDALTGGFPRVRVVGVPSGTGQVKLVPHILSEDPSPDMSRTALVLPDESLLLPLLESIPPETGPINITMGYPASESGVFSLVRSLCTLQMHLRSTPAGTRIYRRSVDQVLSSSVFRTVAGPGEAEALDKVCSEEGFYIPVERLHEGDLSSRVFTQAAGLLSEASAESSDAFISYLMDVLAVVGARLSASEGNALEAECARRCHQALGILRDLHAAVLPATTARLVERALASVSVPFEGEPLRGLQVMGPLETRALDFDNVVIFSSNEGSFPRKSFSPSFIPAELRKGFGLPSYEYQDSVWAYYFYRLVSRAKNVWLVYDTRAEGLHSGEESRYIKQLQYHYGVPLERLEAESSACAEAVGDEIQKTAEDVELIRSGRLSVSRLKDFLACEAKFYYLAVKRLKSSDDDSETMDGGVIGDVFHKSMQELYSRPFVDLGYLESLSASKDRIRSVVRSYILSLMKVPEVTGRDLVTEEVIAQYVLKVIEKDIKLLEQQGLDGFRILGLEKEVTMERGGFNFVGYIDRLDSCRSGEVRIIDYKTGSVEDKDVKIDDADAPALADAFISGPAIKRSDIALQLYMYDMMLDGYPSFKGLEFVNSVYSTSRLFTSDVLESPRSRVFSSRLPEVIDSLLARITDLSVPWKRTSDSGVCSYCDFKHLCGRRLKKK